MAEFDWGKSFAISGYGAVTDVPSRPPDETANQVRDARVKEPRGSFASFVCHVTSLERGLRSSSPLVFDDSSNMSITGRLLGQGKTFMVRHARWVRNPKEPPVDVALKEIISDVQLEDNSAGPSSGAQQPPHSDWKDILFELRALLHEPLRYHPNLVRLLGIQWGLSALSDSCYPVLIMEYASFGTLDALQGSVEPLSFGVKQKLCYDVGRGLSALHSSGIVHGDIKHENVLVFPSRDPVLGLPYTAKLGDFGGAVMDMTPEDFRRVETWTWPFQAPEVTDGRALTRPEMMSTDVYSFGLLVWRTFTDGHGFVSLPGAAQDAPDQDKRGLTAQKATEDFTLTALTDVRRYANTRGISDACLDVISFSIFHTLRRSAADRDLTKAQLALRGISPGHVRVVANFIRERNEEWNDRNRRKAPGAHGITTDSLQFFLGRSGEDADLQGNLPGFRTRLDEPKAGEYLFDPEALKTILTWRQQTQMIDELTRAATTAGHGARSLVGMSRTVASFFLFQCYLLEFGTEFNAAAAVHWLSEAASDDDSHKDADYLAQAWLWRISRSFGVQLGMADERLLELLRLSVLRGHRTALQDLQTLAEGCIGPQRQRWLDTYRQFRHLLQSQMGAVGMGYFLQSRLTPPWDEIELQDLAQLDQAIRGCLGSDHHISLRSSSQPQTGEESPFDKIYVNIRGHGLLHYAAAIGDVNALRHIISTYRCDINLPNKHVDESPLLCACESGKLDCALLLLENGADPNGYRFGQEGPLHWLCSFPPSEMEIIARRLISSGADIELRSGGMRHDVRGIRADWEHSFETRTTPLGRAVLMDDADAVRVLLKLGADPLAEKANKHPEEYEPSSKVNVCSPFQLAAVLTMPTILGQLIGHIDGPVPTPKTVLIDEAQMLDLARGRVVTKVDPLSLQSRLVRCGPEYKTRMKETLVLLHTRALPFSQSYDEAVRHRRSRILCREVSSGNLDIVECLLELGYDGNGTTDWRPLEKAVEHNHEGLFHLLVRYGANVNVKRATPVGYISLLHVCASRRRQCRPGRAIADALIAAGVPVESADARSRPPLATAVLNHNFDVATALLENGANVSASYPTRAGAGDGSEAKTVNVLWEVLSQHTTRTLESLRFLFGRHNEGRGERPPFLIDPTNKLSLLHWLAGSPQFTAIAQITPRIHSLCLETYGEPELINYRHPILGTALYHAAANGNMTMVERLLRHQADAGSDAGPDVEESVQTMLRPKHSWRPLWAAILRLDEELTKGVSFPPAGKPGAWLKSRTIRNLERTIELLSEKETDQAATTAILRLKVRKSQAESNDAVFPGGNEVAGPQRTGNGSPADLGVLKGSREDDEKKIRELRDGPEDEWITPELEAFLVRST